MTSDELREFIENTVWQRFSNVAEPPSDKELADFVNALISMQMNLEPQLKNTVDYKILAENVINSYKASQSYRKEIGSFLTDSDGNKPWLDSVKADVQWHYWNQYKKYLINDKNWSNNVVDSMALDTEKILDLAGNPNSLEPYQKKGLIVASVQSGKTSNYIGLACRAADVGYKYIIIIASTTTDLRLQTQQRVEEGFIGVDYWNRTPTGKPTLVGVGNQYGFRLHPNPGTTRESDFKKNKMSTLMQVDPDNTEQPWVFIIKKNPSTLRNLIAWFQAHRHTGDQLLLIDDEADSASINVKYGKKGISTINALIRELLSLFDRSSYVGYTATPFANVLIDPDEIDEKLGSDLFPRNYIYTLSPSSAYFGPEDVFGDVDETDSPKHLRYILDVDLQSMNKKDVTISFLPESLKRAVGAFLLGSTIRVMRKGTDTHTTMLVNTSAWVSPQKQIQYRINQLLSEEIIPAIKIFAGSSISTEQALANSAAIRFLKEVWDEEYAGNCEYEWEEVFRNIYSIAKVTRTALINYKSQDYLDYDGKIEHVIAIGGNRLSRGLTLEGLIVSYFARNSRAYDTLMQMARWFGYRVGYEDLCRIWMTEESAGWCAFVTDASAELMMDFVDMMQKHMTPMQYGHRIKAFPGTLMVTARNKMGAGELRRQTKLSGKFTETTVLKRDKEAMSQNQHAAEELMRKIEQGHQHESTKFGELVHDVPSENIKYFFISFDNCNDSMATDSDKIRKYVEKYEDEGIGKWDVLLAASTGNNAPSERMSNRTFDFAGSTFNFERRMPGVLTTKDKIFVGNRYKVSTKEIEQVGLTPSEITIAEKMYDNQKGDRKISKDWFYRSQRKRPLLIIHHLDMAFDASLSPDNKMSYESKTEKIDKRTGCRLSVDSWPSKTDSIPAIAWSISLPDLENDQGFDYIFTKAALKGMSLGDDVVDEGEEKDDEEF